MIECKKNFIYYFYYAQMKYHGDCLRNIKIIDLGQLIILFIW